MKNEEAYLYFLEALKNKKEGVFWSRRVETDTQWCFGVGNAQKKHFNDVCFPLFTAIDFLGDRCNAWYFEDYYSNVFNKYPEKIVLTEPSFESVIVDKDISFYAQEKEQVFCKKIKHVQQLQRGGDMWVINLSHKLEGSVEDSEDFLDNFYYFLKSERAHIGGVIWTKELKCISFSPETFLIQDKGQVTTFPIKGTGGKKELKDSSKERSELAMITDLMRNDLSQIARNIRVQKVRSLMNQTDFYHAHAEIVGDLIGEALSEEAFKKLLPAGSISGSPKPRVVEEIRKQESYQRDFYTGTFGVLFSQSYSIFNILIRTLFFSQDLKTWRYPVGAGITLDSVAEKEWEETLRKAEVLWHFFGEPK